MCKIRLGRAAPLAAVMLLSLLVGCQPSARSATRVQMTAPPRTTSVERPVRTANPISSSSAPRQAQTPAVAPVTPVEPSKPVDADSAEDRHPSRWPKKLRAKFAMVIDY